ncbi:uncharacterized protein CLUP02_00680 [Colletotrichum lupini]|uniref:Secreted protein n=1 Tax=Colletotrichum lupini TaxID=145971 RepID=A0A9Q8W7P7_9PEZI|nr:uncharacterized protein CLUP02_00680 [Colletotrichum lupini]KAK1719692.1 hypothetical protein BDP67DRAFT_130554 [Colletotrichum lupini]UQC74033.1 hypothetical protein CLUP02_00680 [Colletotrichum lupini]
MRFILQLLSTYLGCVQLPDETSSKAQPTCSSGLLFPSLPVVNRFLFFPSWHPYSRAFPFYAFRFVSFMPDAFRVSLILRGGLGCRREGWHGMACHRTCYSVLRAQCLRHCPSPSKLPLKGQTKDKVGMKTFFWTLRQK